MPTTSKTGILLMRHGKSDWNTESLSDHDRPLNRRGERDVPRMANLLTELQLIPDQIVSSSAIRALTTAEAMASGLDRPAPKIEPDLYLASSAVWTRFLNRDAARGLSLWVGHNPGLEEFIAQSTGQLIPMATATIAWLQREENSSEWGYRLVQVWRPKEF